ncbi:hypothetical protein [Sphingobacterium sp. HMA12]|uniref:hypothetical protein n=1 Tax=Sphingobacterium sp. HMA12 TaxID=2050894 RepID=UPI0013153B86|nr:hypothetical protein [Sphingobacterium sp. HMA12]
MKINIDTRTKGLMVLTSLALMMILGCFLQKCWAGRYIIGRIKQEKVSNDKADLSIL